MENIREAILSKLKETEEVHDVKIIFAIESGSRAWGFESPSSDYDCRFVYVRKKESYISIFENKNFIEYDVDKIFDINGWDLNKFIKNLIKSNANLLEWLSSNVVYIKNEECTKLLEDLGEQFFNPISTCYHYLSMAKKKYQKISRDNSTIKTYFYVLRALACTRYIYEHKKMPNMEYFKNLEELNIDKEIIEEIKKLHSLKLTVDEDFEVEKSEKLIKYFEDEISFFEENIKNMKFEGTLSFENIDNVFRKIIDRMWDCE